jgi:hypothetical protein
MTNGLHHLDQSAPRISECATLIGLGDIFEIQLTVKEHLLFKKIMQPSFELLEKFSCFDFL